VSQYPTEYDISEETESDLDA